MGTKERKERKNERKKERKKGRKEERKKERKKKLCVNARQREKSNWLQTDPVADFAS